MGGKKRAAAPRPAPKPAPPPPPPVPVKPAPQPPEKAAPKAFGWMAGKGGWSEQSEGDRQGSACPPCDKPSRPSLGGGGKRGSMFRQRPQ